MATETDTSNAGWQINPLKELFASLHNDLKESINERFAEMDRRTEDRWTAQGIAVRDLKRIIDTRLDGMDKASIILSENLNRVPTVLDREIARLTSLTDEKFIGTQRQFIERDVRTAENQKSAETAVNAALSAQKEAVAQQNAAYAAAGAKSEAATTKQIDSIVALLGSQSGGLNDKITAINARLDRDQGARGGASATTSQIITVAAVGIALLGLALNFFTHTPPAPPTTPTVVYAAPPPTATPTVTIK